MIENTTRVTKSRSFIWDELKQHADYQAMGEDPCYFSNSSLGLRSPLNLPDIEIAVKYLHTAIEQKQSICIVGDRDVDGVSSTALLTSFLQENHQGKLSYIVSDAQDDYGLSGKVFEKTLASQAHLVILLDMGTSHGPEIESLIQKMSCRVIVLDHHLLHNHVPDSPHCVLVNPQRNAKQHPVHGGKIATGGLVFKLLFASALSHTREWQRVYLLETKQGLAAFRCGHYLGLFESKEAYSNWEKITYPEKEVAWECIDLQNIEQEPKHFLAKEKENIWEDLDYYGKLLLAKAVESRPRLRDFIRSIADLASFAIVTDLVPLVDENRTLVRIGIGQALWQHKAGQRPYRPGCQALIKGLGLNGERLLSRDIGWSIGPAINAAGRMGCTSLALELLLSQDQDKAKKLACELIKLNEARKRRTKYNEKIITQHFSENQEKLQEPILFCYHPKLKPGVSGILASRLTEKYHKLVIYINHDGEHARGSVRSWANFDALTLLDSATHLFIQFGGHKEACGFSIAYENIVALEQVLLSAYKKITQGMPTGQEPVEIAYHLELKPYQLNERLLAELENMEPFGPQNPEPLFHIKKVHPLNPRYMTNKQHVSFQIPGTPRNLNFIAWNKGTQIEQAIHNKNAVDLYGCLERSTFRGWSEFRFRVESLVELS